MPLRRVPMVLVPACLLALSGCLEEANMSDQPRFEPGEESDFFGDGLSIRTPPEGTVARGQLSTQPFFHTGKRDGQWLEGNPLPVSIELLERGRKQFDIHCSVCHARTGGGQGMVVRRGFPQAATFHQERLRTAPDGYLFGVITDGFHRMPAFKTRLSARERWAVVGYLRALQLSQHATLDDVPEEHRAELEAGE